MIRIHQSLKAPIPELRKCKAAGSLVNFCQPYSSIIDLLIVDLIIRPLATLPIESSEAEIVERKGLGHPDTICDALAEQLSIALCNFYQERFGLLLHHNVDKVLLWGWKPKPSVRG